MNIKIFKKKKTFKKRNSEVDADFYWKIILYLTLFLMLAASAFGFYLFSKVNKGTDASENVTLEHTGTVDKDRILKVLQYFRERENKSASVLNSAQSVVDPSL